MTVVVRYGREESYLAPPGIVGDRPCIPIRLQHGGRHFDTFGIVDSGADTSLFNLQIAVALGFTAGATSTRSIGGVGGNDPVWDFDLHMIAFGKRFPARIAFSTTWANGFGLLGRADFFRAFDVGFDEPRAKVLLRARP